MFSQCKQLKRYFFSHKYSPRKGTGLISATINNVKGDVITLDKRAGPVLHGNSKLNGLYFRECRELAPFLEIFSWITRNWRFLENISGNLGSDTPSPPVLLYIHKQHIGRYVNYGKKAGTVISYPPLFYRKMVAFSRYGVVSLSVRERTQIKLFLASTVHNENRNKRPLLFLCFDDEQCGKGTLRGHSQRTSDKIRNSQTPPPYVLV